MAKIEDLISEIPDARLREELAREVAALKKQKKFGLVFEEHIPEQVQLPGLPVKPGAQVVKRGGDNKEVFIVEGVHRNGRTSLRSENGGEDAETVATKDLVVVKRFGEPIYPTMVPVARLTRAEGKPYHTIINADNFHALQLLLYCYAGQVDVIYIDPPYNTGARDWKYNNDYVDSNDQWRHSKWLSMMKKRLLLAAKLLRPSGILCITIDDCEVHHLKCLLEEHLKSLEIFGTVAIKTSPSGRPTVRGFRTNHEYALFLGRADTAEIGGVKRSDAQLALFKETDESGSFTWANLRKRGGANTLREARPKQFYPFYVKGESFRIPELEWDKQKREWRILEPPRKDELVLYPIGDDGKERIWSLGNETARQQTSSLKVDMASKGKTRILRKMYLESEESRPSTWWENPCYFVVEHGTVLLEQLLGRHQAFPFPKSVYAVADCLRVCSGGKENALILDFFAGSGTTYHATALLNEEDNGNRRCILVTNNEVNEKQAKQLNGEGLFPGDPEFEKHGICESVTWPRCKFVTQGHRDDGTPLPGKYLDGGEMKDGFEENLEYLRLDFLDPHEVAYGEKFEAILPILWLMAGAKGERETARGYGKWFIPKNSPYAVLIKEEHFAEFQRELRKRPDINLVFLVTDSEEAYREMSAELPGKPETKMLYRSYRDNFRINTERNL